MGSRLVIGISSLLSVLAAATPAGALAPRNGMGGNDVARDTGVSPDGSTVFVTGNSEGSGTLHDYATVAYDATTGAELWVARYAPPKTDSPNDLAVSPDGITVFVTGVSEGAGTADDYATVAYDVASGAELWVARYSALPAKRSDTAYALSVSPDSSTVFVTGSSQGAGTAYDYATVAYDATTGAELWVARYTQPARASDSAYALEVSPDGSRVFVTGSSQGAGTLDDYATVAYDATTGAELWVARYTLPARRHDAASALGVTPDGSTVFITGGSEGSGTDYDYATVAYDAVTGAEVWVARYALPNYEAATALTVSPDGSVVFVTGISEGSGTNFGDYATVAYDAATGAELWVARYDPSGLDTAYALGVSPDGSTVFVTGESQKSGGNYDYATVAYDAATGAELWVSRYALPSYDAAFALAVRPNDSTVFVTGESLAPLPDYATVAYDAVTGAEQWVARYDGPGP